MLSRLYLQCSQPYKVAVSEDVSILILFARHSYVILEVGGVVLHIIGLALARPPGASHRQQSWTGVFS